MQTRDIVRVVVGSLFFGLPVIFHLAALFWPGISIAETPETHLAFILINGLFVFAFVKNVQYLTLGLSALTIHQIWVHGVALIESIVSKNIDYQSLGVLIGLALVWVYIVVDSITPKRLMAA